MIDGWVLYSRIDIPSAVWMSHPKQLYQPNVNADVFRRMYIEGNLEEIEEVDKVASYELSGKGTQLYKHLMAEHAKKFYEPYPLYPES